MSHDEVPRDTRSVHVVAIRDGGWSCSCGRAGTAEGPVGLLWAATEHEKNPEGE